MNHSKEMIAAGATVLIASLGATACSPSPRSVDSDPTQPVGSQSANTSPSPNIDPNRTQQLDSVAKSIVAAAELSDSSFSTRPAGTSYRTGFSVKTKPQGTVKFDVQAFDADLRTAPGQIIGMEQTIPNGRSFNLLFNLRPDGTWNTFCTDNVAVEGMGRSQVGQRTVYLGAKTVLEDKNLANAILDQGIANATAAIDTVKDDPNIPIAKPLPNPCEASLGDGASG